MVRLTLANVWGKSIYPSLGLGYIAGYLKKYGQFSEISIVECTRNEALGKIRKTRPDIVGFGSTTPGFSGNVSVAEKLKRELDVLTAIGGTHITSLPQTLPQSFDFGILGEGEQTFLELLNAVEGGKTSAEQLKKIDGLAFHDWQNIAVSKPRALIEPLDLIPVPARELFDMGHYLKKRDVLCSHELLRGTSMMSSRGCPYHCIYCQASRHWSKLRMNSAGYVAEEIQLLHDKYKVEALAIVDDLFIADKKRVAEIVKELEERHLLGEIKYLVDGRANLIDAELLALLKKMGVANISIGFESGSGRVLHFLKKNSVTLKQNLDCMQQISSEGFNIYGQFIIGSPGETREDILQTVEFMKNPAITTAHVSVMTPLPGTEIWDHYLKQNPEINVANIDWRRFDMDPISRKDNSVYVGDIPFKEFAGLYNEARAVSMSKEASGKGFWRLENIPKALKQPLFSIKLFFGLLKKKLGVK